MMNFNIVITPVFWIILRTYSWSLFPAGTPLAAYVLVGLHHILPLFTSIVNLLLTKQYFLHKTSKIVLIMTLVYIPTNLFGCYLMGEPIYPYWFDWSNPLLTLSVFLSQSFLLYHLQNMLATYT